VADDNVKELDCVEASGGNFPVVD